jgi:hypothetical protein
MSNFAEEKIRRRTKMFLGCIQGALPFGESRNNT